MSSNGRAAMGGRQIPSLHGSIVGDALSELERAGREVSSDLPDMCATCAFRSGCMTNLMAGTVLVAFKCAVGADPSPFGCHHGMANGEPTKLCAGHAAAQAVAFEKAQEISARMMERLNALPSDEADDPIQADARSWLAVVDPENKLNDYQRGRLWLTRDRQPATLSKAKDSAHDQ